jgi:hypothetical protein
LQTVEGLLARDVSCVIEYVVRTHRPTDLERLRAAADFDPGLEAVLRFATTDRER